MNTEVENGTVWTYGHSEDDGVSIGIQIKGGRLDIDLSIEEAEEVMTTLAATIEQARSCHDRITA